MWQASFFLFKIRRHPLFIYFLVPLPYYACINITKALSFSVFFRIERHHWTGRAHRGSPAINPPRSFFMIFSIKTLERTVGFLGRGWIRLLYLWCSQQQRVLKTRWRIFGWSTCCGRGSAFKIPLLNIPSLYTIHSHIAQNLPLGLKPR